MGKIKMPAVLLVLGAGSSKDLSFPLGAEMLRLILHKTCTQRKGDDSEYISDLVNKLKDAGLLDGLLPLRERIWEKSEEYEYQMLRNLSTGPQSIDHYLMELMEAGTAHEHGAEWYDIIRFAISYLMLGYEAAIHQRESEVFDASRLWSMQMLDKLIQTYGWEQVSAKLHVITFNYERTFEHAVYQTLVKHGAPKADDERFEGECFMQNNIHHVYGKTGKYCPPGKSHEDCVPFGVDNKTARQMQAVFRTIDLIRKGTDLSNTNDEELFRKWFEAAQEIYFLGFGFAKDNQKKLQLVDHDTFNVFFSEKKVRSTKVDPGQRGQLEQYIEFTDYYCEEFVRIFCLNADRQKD